MPANHKKKKQNYVPALTVVIVTVIVVIIGVVVLPKAGKSEKEKKGAFATSETVSVTEPLGSFADFNVSEAIPTQYNDAATSDAFAPAEENATTASGRESTSAVVPGSTTNSPSGSTTNPPSGSTTGVASDYAYSYAGFNPKPANMNANWNLILVNRNYILPEDYSPELSPAVKGSSVRLDARVSPYYQQMFDAAQKDGINLTPLSGHRRISTQKTNFENKINLYVNQGYDRAEATRKAATIILPPGTSEHNAGLAMDIISLDVEFEETKAFAWLQEHAQDYGFILRYPKNKEAITGITYEPWHWRFVGVQTAKAIKASGKCLEEYLGAA